MARSGFHHSVNYRAVMAFGKAHVIDDPEEKLKLMDRFIDRIYPGRSKLIRQPNKQEFKATTMIGMEIETASGKIRDKHVADEEEDYEGVPAWSALYPITQVLGEPSDCPRQLAGPHAAGRDVRLRAGQPLRRADDQELSADVWGLVDPFSSPAECEGEVSTSSRGGWERSAQNSGMIKSYQRIAYGQGFQAHLSVFRPSKRPTSTRRSISAPMPRVPK